MSSRRLSALGGAMDGCRFLWLAAAVVILAAFAGLRPASAAAVAPTAKWIAQWNTDPAGKASGVELATFGRGDLFAGATFVTAKGADRILVARYTRAGDSRWVRLFKWRGATALGLGALAVDRSRHVYVLGTVRTAGRGQDWLILKYSPSGKVLWMRRIDGRRRDDFAGGLAVTPGGAAYATGAITLGDGSTEALTVKYSRAGKLLWRRRFGGASHLGANGAAIALDRSDNAYIAGSSVQSAGRASLTAKYRSNGRRVWVRTQLPSDGASVQLRAIAVSSAGVAVGGVWTATAGGSPGAVDAVYSTSGDGALTFGDTSLKADIDAVTLNNGGLFGIAGTSTGRLAGGVLRLSSPLPVSSYISPLDGVATRIAMVADGSFYLTGLVHVTNAPDAALVAAIDNKSGERWSTTLGAASDSEADGLVYSPGGVYVAMNLGPDLTLYKFAP